MYAQLLRKNPDFTRLWLAQVVSLLGDWFNTIVLSALVARYSGESGLGFAVSGFLLARFVPPLLVGPFAGVLVDRFDRKWLLIASDISRALVVLLFLFATGPETLWLIYLLTVIQFSLSAVFEPARSAILPSLLRQDDLVIANTLSSVTWSVMLAVGAIIGGVVASALGTAFALVVDSISFAVSALLITQIRAHPGAAGGDAAVRKAEHPSQRGFVDGLRFAGQHPNVLATLLVKLGQSIGNADALMIVYATNLFVLGEGGTTSLSLMYASFGIGAVIGPILLNRLNDKTVRVMRRLIVVGYAWIALGWLVFGSASALGLVLLALVLRAMGGSVNWTYSSVILQKSVPDHFLGRMFSLDMAGFQFASVVSTLVTGLLVQASGVQNVRQVVLIMGIASLVPLAAWSAVVLWLERREIAAVPAAD